jgi:hypothetical protein
VVALREYNTEPATERVLSVFVYLFASDGAAAASEPLIRNEVLSGTRAKVIRDGHFVFWIEAPVQLPGWPNVMDGVNFTDVNATFDAVVAALTSS